MTAPAAPPRTLLAYTSGLELSDDYFARKIPVGLGLLGAVLNQAGFPAEVGNFSTFDDRRLRRAIERARPDVVGLSVFTFNRHASHELAALARELFPQALVVAGGPHVTHLAREWLEAYPAFDAVVLGEGEDTLEELVRRRARGEDPAGTPGTVARDRSGKLVWGPPRAAIDDLDRLPHAAQHLHRSIGIDVPDQLRYFISSRGCPGACTFCNTPDFWGRRVRFRSASDVLAEVRELRDRHGLAYVSFRDDTFTAHRDRTIEICKGLVDSGLHFLWDCQSRVNLIDEERLGWMKRAGCQHIQYGIESGSDRILKLLQKDISREQIRQAVRLTREAGLRVSVYLISGVPDERDEDIAATVALLEETLPHDGIVAPLAIYPGTRLYTDSKAWLSVDDSLWLKDPRDSIYLREDPEARRHQQELLEALERVGRRAAYKPADFDRFERKLGWTFTDQLWRSEWHRQQGELGPACEAALDITRRQPANPWGWIRLHDLEQEAGDGRAAGEAMAEARRLVPRLRV